MCSYIMYEFVSAQTGGPVVLDFMWLQSVEYIEVCSFSYHLVLQASVEKD